MLVNGHLRCGGPTKCREGEAGPVHGVAQVGVEWGSPAVGPLHLRSGCLCEPWRAWKRRRSLDLTLCVVSSWALDVVLTLSPGRVPENQAPPLQLGRPAVFQFPIGPAFPGLLLPTPAGSLATGPAVPLLRPARQLGVGLCVPAPVPTRLGTWMRASLACESGLSGLCGAGQGRGPRAAQPELSAATATLQPPLSLCSNVGDDVVGRLKWDKMYKLLAPGGAQISTCFHVLFE